jgi:5-methylcytosine-specific restriction endonuclease McrA
MATPKAIKRLRKLYNEAKQLAKSDNMREEVETWYRRELTNFNKSNAVKREAKKAKRKTYPKWKRGMSWPAWYELYLRCPHWQTTRAAALRRAGHQCESCGAVETLQVHHLTYKRLRRELPTDLKVLCRVCHMEAHGLETVDSVTLNFLRLDLGNNSR